MSRAERVLAALGDPVIAVARDRTVAVWTPAAERLFGLTADEVLGRDLPDVGIRLEILMGGRERRLTLRRRTGGPFTAMVRATPLLGPEGERTGVVLVVKDLTSWIGPAAETAAGPSPEEAAEQA